MEIYAATTKLDLNFQNIDGKSADIEVPAGTDVTAVTFDDGKTWQINTMAGTATRKVTAAALNATGIIAVVN